MQIAGTGNSILSSNISILKSANEQSQLASELISRTVESMVKVGVAQSTTQRINISEVTGSGTIINTTAWPCPGLTAMWMRFGPRIMILSWVHVELAVKKSRPKRPVPRKGPRKTYFFLVLFVPVQDPTSYTTRNCLIAEKPAVQNKNAYFRM